MTNNVKNHFKQGGSSNDNDLVIGGCIEYTKEAIMTAFGDVGLGEADYTARVCEFITNALSQTLPKPYAVKPANYTLTNDDFYIELSTAGTTAFLNITDPLEGQACHVDNSSNGYCYVTPITGSETITLQPNEGSYFVYNGTNWRIK